MLEGATLSYDTATTPDVCTVAADGALTLLAVGTCTVRVTAAATSNYTADETTATVTVNPAGALSLVVHAVTGDDIINRTEQADGFSIEGHTGTEAGVTVTVTLGGHRFATVDSALAPGAIDAAWSVAVAPNADYLTDAATPALTVAATRTGYTSPSDFTNTLTVDLTAPTAPGYTAPANLTVGVAITPLIPTGGTGIATSNGHAAAGLPAGLALDVDSGEISGAPTAHSTDEVTATVTVTDRAGNSAAVAITFPAVARGTQDLSAFAYTPASLNYNAAAPVLTPPTVLEGATLSYDTATTPDVCTVAADGALTLLAVGTCTVRVTAAATSNYTADETTATVTVNPAGALSLVVHAVTGDDIINRTEQADGFSIEGHTGTEAGVTVTVTLGGHRFATVDSALAPGAIDAAWSVAVAPNADYLTDAATPALTVAAAKTGYTSPSDFTNTLTVDLTAPTAPGYTAPANLTVGVAITPLIPTGGTGIATSNGHAAAGLPAGLALDVDSGEISGAPTAHSTDEVTATVTVTDRAGNSDRGVD